MMEEQTGLFENAVVEKVKIRKGIITIGLDSKENPFCVDFEGYNEGSGFPCEDEKEVKEKVEFLKLQHKGYNLEIKDLRKKQQADYF